QEVGAQCEPGSTIYLLGGTALGFLGGSRPTVDLDYVGSDVKVTMFQELLSQIADEMQLEIEAVPIDEFVPVPSGANERAIFIEAFGNLNVYVIDPYTIALSKIDRGFDTDIEDVVFLCRNGFVDMDRFVQMIETAVAQAAQFDLDPQAMQRHLQAVQKSL
ncbi:MAG: hypothetical protein KDE51_05600, partial [Anaerolineales bacterium]|nr:hypothetical protein [Anaerolineales bacterium]